MDQPQHQVFGADRHSYRFMSYPFRKQHLQLLYPGRFLTTQDYYTGENIPNENMDGLDETRESNAILSHVARMEMEALQRHLGGKHPVVPHPAVEPEAPTEDPALTNLTMRDTGGLNPDLDEVPSPYDHLNRMEEDGRQIVKELRETTQARGQAPMTPTNPDNTLPRYDWQSLPEREYYLNMSSSDGSSSDSRMSVSQIAFAIILVIAIVAVVFLIYGVSKNKSISNALKPKNYKVVDPQFLPPRSFPDM